MNGYADDRTGPTEDAASPTVGLQQEPVRTDLIEEYGPRTERIYLIRSDTGLSPTSRPRDNCNT